MDFAQVAKFFDRQDFDTYNAATATWSEARFKGQIKVSDKFVSMWNRATRKRMLYVGPEEETLLTPVIRVNGLSDIYMVGTIQHDSHANTYYRAVAPIQHVSGPATVNRKAPTGGPSDPGWAVNTVVSNTYADYELRSSAQDNTENTLNYGDFFLFLPSDVPLQREDTVTVSGRTFYVFESYYDSGLIGARATAEPDSRVNLVYTRVTGQTYNPNTQTVTDTVQAYNVTGRIKPSPYTEGDNSTVNRRQAVLTVRTSWFPGAPELRDKFTYNSATYIVDKIEQDQQQDEWVITGYV